MFYRARLRGYIGSEQVVVELCDHQHRGLGEAYDCSQRRMRQGERGAGLKYDLTPMKVYVDRWDVW